MSGPQPDPGLSDPFRPPENRSRSAGRRYQPIPAERMRADARNRALRTFLQGLAIDVAVSVCVVLITVFATASSWGELQWVAIGFTLGKTVLMTIAAYVMRRFVDRPGSVALPPDLAGAPSDTGDRDNLLG
jgi:hypothetical protein